MHFSDQPTTLIVILQDLGIGSGKEVDLACVGASAVQLEVIRTSIQQQGFIEVGILFVLSLFSNCRVSVADVCLNCMHIVHGRVPPTVWN